jgi:uncharacterized protein YndB with AHSA1/START domain
MDHPLVQVETIIAAPPGAVWDTMVKKPSTLFMGAKVETDWKVGHPITMSGAFNGKPFKDGGEIRSFDPAHQLSFTHRSGTSKETNLVTFLLEPQGQDTRVRLSQTPLGEGETKVSEDQKAKFAKTWSAMLDALKKEVVRQQ